MNIRKTNMVVAAMTVTLICTATSLNFCLSLASADRAADSRSSQATDALQTQYAQARAHILNADLPQKQREELTNLFDGIAMGIEKL